MSQEFSYVVYGAETKSEVDDFRRVPLPPVLLRIEKRLVKYGSMMYFPPLDDCGESHALSSEGLVTTIKVQWGDVVPGSFIQLGDTNPPKESIEVTIRWSMFMPGIVLYFSGSHEIPIKIKNHPMVLVVPWRESKKDKCTMTYEKDLKIMKI